MKQLVIKKEDFYVKNGREFFKFICPYGRVVIDVYVELSKNNKYILELIAITCELNWKGLKKNELVDLIEKSNCLVSE